MVTSGGIIGTVAKVQSDTEIQVEIAEGVRVRVLRGMITEVVAKTGHLSQTTPPTKTKKKPPNPRQRSSGARRAMRATTKPRGGGL